MSSNNNFEKFLKNKYWQKEEFRNIVEKSAKRTKQKNQDLETKISNYLKRIENIVTDERGKEHFKNQILYPQYIIKKDQIPEEHLKNILFNNFTELKGYNREQANDPEIRQLILDQFEKETGKNFKDYKITKEEEENLINQIITDQKRSLDYWFDYLTSKEAENYPLAFRYWVLAEVLKLGSYDEKRKEFNKRTEKTIAPFPPLNQQALALVLDEILKKYNKQPSNLILNQAQQEELNKHLQVENFNKLYSWALEYLKTLKLPKERLPIIKGKWRLFEKGSDPKELVATLKDYNIGWCIQGEGMAANYLSHSNIHIYFSEDEKNNPTIPRLAIVENGSSISEVRGIAQNQNIDQYITPVLKEKLNELPDGERYQKRTNDMKKLAQIYLKYKQKQELTKEELRFIYEIDDKIESFGYQKDSRIDEIINQRDKRKDLAKIFNCKEHQIAFNKDDIFKHDDIIFYWGDLNLDEFTSFKDKKIKLPEIIRGYLSLKNLKSAKGLELPREVGDLYLNRLESAKGLKLPEIVRGHLSLVNLKSAEGLELPKEVGGTVFFEYLPNSEIEALRRKYPNLII